MPRTTGPLQGPWAPSGSRPKALHAVAALLGVRAARPLPPGEVVTGVCQDSRSVRPGDLYVALRGARSHGADFAGEAAARGAVAAVSDLPCTGLPTLLVPDPRTAAGPLADWVYDHPSRQVDVYGVTGTNGKTSTTHLLEAALMGAGVPAGLVGGVVVRGPAGERPAHRTTPEAAELQGALAALRDQGARAAAVEVSSHGVVLHRIDGTRFRAAVFTNLGHDHLDLHGSMEAYFEAKAQLFHPERCTLAVVSVDDVWGRRLAAQTRAPTVTFSAAGRDADWTASEVRATATGTGFRVRGPGVDLPVHLRLLGAHQVDNALGALCALASTGLDPAAAARGMARLAVVPGRLEAVDVGQPFLAVVDHVHNTHGQQRLLPYLRSIARGRIHLVVGITGERDPSKRAPLGRAAAAGADTVVITDESPYSEDPQVLREALAAGARSAAGGARVVVEPDRAAAIRCAVDLAEPGDVVVVAGRGHDRELVAGGAVRGFDDRAELRRALLGRDPGLRRPA